jgi:hypothetical protein
MRRGIVIAGAAALAVVAAVVVYFAVVPGVLASGYRDDARPEHRRVQAAMERLYASFVPATFGEPPGAPHSVKALRRQLELERAAVRRARTRVRDADAALRRADEGKLTDVPSWPALGLGDAKDVAALERDYLRQARAFVASYRRLVDYSLAVREDYTRAVSAVGGLAADVPEHPTTPEQIARPVDAAADRLDRATRTLRRRDPPPGLREQHRLDVGAFGFLVRELRGLADAVRARDLAKAKGFDEAVSGGIRRYTGGGRARLRRLIARSRYAHAIGRLRHLQLRIQHGYDGL